MNNVHRFLAVAAFFAVFLSGTVMAQNGFVETDLVVNKLVNNVPTLTDGNGIVHVAKFYDPNLVNPWGVGDSPTSPFWVSDNNAGKATLYNTAGSPQGLVVSIPVPGDPLGSAGAPTGLVFNTALGQGAFKISGVNKNGLPAARSCSRPIS